MTTRKLILIRHAKAEAGGIDDKQRKLAPRGERDSGAVGRWLKQAGFTSGVALVSPARRTMQTWELAANEIGRAPRTVHDDRIYLASVDELLAVIGGAPPRARTLLVVGHNPSIEMLAEGLDDGNGNKAAAKEMRVKYPTSGVALFEIAGPWSGLELGHARLVSFTVPAG